MDIVKLYYDSRDINPSIMLQLFLRTIGIYVCEFSPKDDHQESNDYLAAIYIISNNYAEARGSLDDSFPNSSNVIVILKDGYVANSNDINFKTIKYPKNDNNERLSKEEETKFLNQLIDILSDLIREKCNNTSIFYKNDDVKSQLSEIVSGFVDLDIAQYMFYTRYFFADPAIYNSAKISFEEYRKLLNDCKKDKSVLQIFVDMANDYNFDLIKKKNGYLDKGKTVLEKKFDALPISTYLLKNNKAFQILMGDIFSDLTTGSMREYDAYVRCEGTPYAYVWYRLGDLYLRYSNAKNAKIFYDNAISIYPNYYRAWYKLAMCNVYLHEDAEAIKCYKNVTSILSQKEFEKILSPFEFGYILNSCLCYGNIFYDKYNNLTGTQTAYNHADKLLGELKKQKFTQKFGGHEFATKFNDSINATLDACYNQEHLEKIKSLKKY